MAVQASQVKIGDMVSLEDDAIFDRGCEFDFCVFRTENAELVDFEPDGDFRLQMTFQTSHETFTESVPLTHRFADPE